MISPSKLQQLGEQHGWVKRRVCAAAGITRPTLDLWIARLGFDWPRGKDSRGGLYLVGGKEVKHTKKHSKVACPEDVTSRDVRPNLDDMETADATDPRSPASVRVRESIWMRMRMAAIKRRTSAAALAEEAFVKFLDTEPDLKGEK